MLEKTVRVCVPGTSANCGPGFDTLGVACTVYNELELTLLEEERLEIAVTAAGKLNAQHLAAIVREIEVNIARAYTLRLVIKRNHAIPSQNVIRDDYYPRLSLNATRRFAGNTHYQQSALKS